MMKQECSVCHREVGVVSNWNKRQAGRLIPEYRFTRHARIDPSVTRDRRPICSGTGIRVENDKCLIT